MKKIGLVIKPSDLDGDDGKNINGPICIEVPNWCPDRLGKFYLYFSHHSGRYIRMAYADNVEGPWKIHRGGVLGLTGLVDAFGHVASPEIYIDHAIQTIRLYFHAPSRSKGEQWTYVAVSKNGLTFNNVVDQPLAPFYLRVFRHAGYFYGFVKGGNLWRSKSGLEPFEPGVNPFDQSLSNEIWHNFSGAIRHVGIHKNENTLRIFFSKIGDKPERIYEGGINLAAQNWEQWRVTNIRECLRPTERYEGADLPLSHSTAGAAHYPENAVRDPFLFEHVGRQMLFYSTQGEQGIAIAELSG